MFHQTNNFGRILPHVLFIINASQSNVVMLLKRKRLLEVKENEKKNPKEEIRNKQLFLLKRKVYNIILMHWLSKPRSKGIFQNVKAGQHQ